MITDSIIGKYIEGKSRDVLPRPRFQPESSRIRSRSAVYSIAIFGKCRYENNRLHRRKRTRDSETCISLTIFISINLEPVKHCVVNNIRTSPPGKCNLLCVAFSQPLIQQDLCISGKIWAACNILYTHSWRATGHSGNFFISFELSCL
jgi:hypothetical protein